MQEVGDDDDHIWVGGRRFRRDEYFGDDEMPEKEPVNINSQKDLIDDDDHIWVGGRRFRRDDYFRDDKTDITNDYENAGESEKNIEENDKMYKKKKRRNKNEEITPAENEVMKQTADSIGHLEKNKEILQEKGLSLEILNDNNMYLINEKGKMIEIPLGGKKR